MDKRRTQVNGPKNKEIDDDTQPRDDIDYMCQEKKEEEDTPALSFA